MEEIAQAKGGGAWHVSSFDYDSRLRLCRRSVPETGDTLYAYNNANEMTAYAEGQSGSGCATPPTASRVLLSYDDLGRLATTNYPSGTSDISRTYDANGNLKTVNRGGVNWTYTYNSADLIGSEKLTLDGRTYQTTNSYDNNERLTQKVFPSGNAYAYNNDGLGRPMCIEHNGGGYVRNVDWHPNGKIASLTRGNDELYEQVLNARQLVQSIGSYGEDLHYFYDRNGRVTDIVADVDGAYDRVFEYDGAGRLETAYGPWGAGSYSYDPLGNITQKQLGSRTVDIQYTGLNRVNRVRDTGVSGSWRSYSHDVRGNVTNDGRHGFDYDHANQPIAVSGADGGSYAYDGHLRRVKQVVNGETIYSICDQSGALLTRDNATTGTETDYLAVAGQTFVRLKNGVATYPLNDHLGTALMVANQNGSIPASQQFNYTPFGETYGAYSPGTNNEQGYTGHVEDETGLTYMQARYYDPVMGRFLSTDPVGYEDQLNLYAYVANDPLNATDPNGEFANFLIGAAIGAVIEVVAIKASGGDVFSKEGLSQVGKGAALGLVGGGIAGGVSKGIRALGKANGVLAGQEIGKGLEAANKVGADSLGGLVAGMVTEAGDQIIESGEITNGEDVARAGLVGAAVGATASVVGQVAESGVGVVQGADSSAAAVGGGAASATVDLAAGVCGSNEVDC